MVPRGPRLPAVQGYRAARTIDDALSPAFAGMIYQRATALRVAVVTKDDQLNELVVAHREVERHDQRVRQTALVEAAVDGRCHDGLFAMGDRPPNPHDETLPHDLARGPRRDGRHAPMLCELGR